MSLVVIVLVPGWKIGEGRKEDRKAGRKDGRTAGRNGRQAR
jgi:hypothetical protein